MFEVIGIIASILVFVFFVMMITKYTNNESVLVITIFDFGFAWVKIEGSIVHKKLNEARKTEGKRFFLSAPRWFNTKVWNIGGSKK